MCKNLDSPHPLTPSPKNGRRGTRICLPSPIFGRGAGGEGKDLSKIGMLPTTNDKQQRTNDKNYFFCCEIERM
jgi:hypothetical protein